MATSTYKRMYKYWVATELSFPLGILLVSAYLAHIYNVPNAFVRMLGGLDLLAIAGVILLAVRLEIEFDTHHLQLDSDALDNFSLATYCGGILLIVLYGGMKPYALEHEAPGVINMPVSLKSYGLAFFSVAFYLVAAGLACWAKHLLIVEKGRSS